MYIEHSILKRKFNMKINLKSLFCISLVFSSYNSMGLELRPMAGFEDTGPIDYSQAVSCLDYIGANRNDDLGIRNCIIDKPSQEWFFTEWFDGSYRIENGEGGCLDDLYGSKYVGVWGKCHTKSNQKWRLIKNDASSTYLIKSEEGNCLDLGDNGKLYAWKCHGKLNQKWLITDGGYIITDF